MSRSHHDARSKGGKQPGRDKTSPQTPPPRLLSAAEARTALASAPSASSTASAPVSTPSPTHQLLATPPVVLLSSAPSSALQSADQNVTPSVGHCALRLLNDALDQLATDALNAALAPESLSSSFTAVAAVGLQSSGKSSLLNHIAGAPLFAVNAGEPWLHTTSGVDAFVTADRLILLDTQPLLSSSIMSQLASAHQQAAHSSHLHGHYFSAHSGEQLHYIHSLQLLSWLLSTAHVVLLTVPWCTPLHSLGRFVQAAFTLASPVGGELLAAAHQRAPVTGPAAVPSSATAALPGWLASVPYVPRDAVATSVLSGVACASLWVVFTETPARYCGGSSDSSNDSALAAATQLVRTLLSETPLLADRVRGFAFPSPHEPAYAAHVHALRLELLAQGAPAPLLSGGASAPSLSEREWLRRAARQWDSVRKKSLFGEYTRTLQKLGIWV